jgi:hypothetical protein
MIKINYFLLNFVFSGCICTRCPQYSLRDPHHPRRHLVAPRATAILALPVGGWRAETETRSGRLEQRWTSYP